MTLEPHRRPPSRWGWTLVGLLQLGNAAAFGAVAASVDFSGHGQSAVQNTVVAAARDESAADRVPSYRAESFPAAAVPNVDVPMPTFAIAAASPLAEPSAPAWSAATVASDPLASTSNPLASTPVEQAAPVLVNPTDNQLTVCFLVNGERIDLSPGEQRQLSGGDAWVVRFHRGGEFGAATHVLYDGEHSFSVGPQGWRLEPAGESSR